MKPTRKLDVIAIALHHNARASRGLLSWNDGPPKQSIVEFVTKVTRVDSRDFVPAPERSAVFWLMGLNSGVLEVVRHPGFNERLGRKRLLFNVHAAIEPIRRWRQPQVAPCNRPYLDCTE